MASSFLGHTYRLPMTFALAKHPPPPTHTHARARTHTHMQTRHQEQPCSPLTWENFCDLPLYLVCMVWAQGGVALDGQKIQITNNKTNDFASILPGKLPIFAHIVYWRGYQCMSTNFWTEICLFKNQSEYSDLEFSLSLSVMLTYYIYACLYLLSHTASRYIVICTVRITYSLTQVLWCLSMHTYDRVLLLEQEGLSICIPYFLRL